MRSPSRLAERQDAGKERSRSSSVAAATSSSSKFHRDSDSVYNDFIKLQRQYGRMEGMLESKSFELRQKDKQLEEQERRMDDMKQHIKSLRAQLETLSTSQSRRKVSDWQSNMTSAGTPLRHNPTSHNSMDMTSMASSHTPVSPKSSFSASFHSMPEPMSLGNQQRQVSNPLKSTPKSSSARGMPFSRKVLDFFWDSKSLVMAYCKMSRSKAWNELQASGFAAECSQVVRQRDFTYAFSTSFNRFGLLMTSVIHKNLLRSLGPNLLDQCPLQDVEQVRLLENVARQSNDPTFKHQKLSERLTKASELFRSKTWQDWKDAHATELTNKIFQMFRPLIDSAEHANALDTIRNHVESCLVLSEEMIASTLEFNVEVPGPLGRPYDGSLMILGDKSLMDGTSFTGNTSNFRVALVVAPSVTSYDYAYFHVRRDILAKAIILPVFGN